MQRQLDSPLRATWSGQPLRESISHLAEAQHVAFFFDRRIDPGQKLDIELADTSLRAAFELLAEHQQLGFSQFGPVAYFGPPQAAGQLRTLAALADDEVDKLPREKKTPLARTRTTQWNDLAVPRELMEQIAKEHGIELAGLDLVPHDLWPSGSLPPLDAVDRLTLLAIGFGLRVRVEPETGALTLVAIEAEPRLVRSYSAGANPQEVADKLAKYLPDAELKVSAGKLFVRGRLEDHERVAAALRGEPITQVVGPRTKPDRKESAGTQIYTLNVQNKPLRPTLQALAKSLQVTLEMDDEKLRAADIDPQQLFSFQVKEATFEELWRAALDSTGLEFKREGDTVRVTPRAK